MFQYVHHVHYVVQDRDAMVEYLEKSFGMKPAEVNDIPNEKEALYNIGDTQTQIQIVEPLDPNSAQGKFLATHGPGLYHVGWGVDNIRELAQALAQQGSKTLYRGKAVPSGDVYQSSHGYLNFTIDPASSQGIFIQLAGPRKRK